MFTAVSEGVRTPEAFIDRCGRRFRKLRISITESCNLACLYCGGGTYGVPRNGVLNAQEIVDAVRNLCSLGINEVRLTGGEPTLRADLPLIIQELSALPLRKLGLTTNGVRLLPLLPALCDSACRHINFSLDSLRPERFFAITGSNQHAGVVDAIVNCTEAGLHTKVNVVMMRGINDDEMFDYIDFSARHGVEVRFLELMPIGPLHASAEERFVAAQEIIDRIRARITLLPELKERDSTSFNFRTGSGARIGFIASESKSFCRACSRLRLTARGTLRSCLMDDREVSLRGMAAGEYPALIRRMLAMKPVTGQDIHLRSQATPSMCAVGG